MRIVRMLYWTGVQNLPRLPCNLIIVAISQGSHAVTLAQRSQHAADLLVKVQYGHQNLLMCSSSIVIGPAHGICRGRPPGRRRWWRPFDGIRTCRGAGRWTAEGPAARKNTLRVGYTTTPCVRFGTGTTFQDTGQMHVKVRVNVHV